MMLQSDILKNNLIPKIILGTKDSYNEDWGGTFSASVLDKFYKYLKIFCSKFMPTYILFLSKYSLNSLYFIFNPP